MPSETMLDKSSLNNHTITGVDIGNLEHISVCVCTYKRPALLENLLKGMFRQKTEDLFTYSMVVVDNDPDKSAARVIEYFQSLDTIKIDYQHEPQKGITYARNRSLEHAVGEYIAILDDDEMPADDWLLQLYNTLKLYQADAVFGTVMPNFEIDPPEWITNRKFFYWRDVRKTTGERTNKNVTNNVLMRRDLVQQYNLKFDHAYAFAGGEDQAFFYELEKARKDTKYVDCKDAVVHEFITADRCSPDYIQKRNILEGRGKVFGRFKYTRNRFTKFFAFIHSFGQSYFRILAISTLLPFILLYDRDLGAEFYYKNYYQLGVLLALFNFSPYMDRKSIGLQ